MNLTAVKTYLKKMTTRPILHALHYENDEIIVCDTISLIIEKTTCTIDTLLNIDISTGHQVAGTYPTVHTIKPSNDKLQEVNMYEITFGKDDMYYYVINNHSFSRDQVDRTLKVIDKNFLKMDMTEFKVSKEHERPYLVYETSKHYVLILGLRSI